MASDVQTTWEVMAVFAQESVLDPALANDDGDLMLAQFGTYDWGAGEAFELDITRQFSFVDEQDEYSHMTQLSCTFRYDATADLRALGGDSLWSSGMELPAFFDAAAALPGFSFVRDGQLNPQALQIEYGLV